MMSFQLEIELRHHNKLLMDEVESLKTGAERSWLQISNQADRIEELEAKLKIAVEALENCEKVERFSFMLDGHIKNALTKIKGDL